MLSLSAHVQVFLAVEPVDLRKGFDGLRAAVESVFGRDVLDGHLFLFLNRRRDRVKLLWWDRDGLAIFYKRLERGTYELPRHEAGTRQVALDATELALLLGGVQLSSVKHRPRYRREASSDAARSGPGSERETRAAS
jgi:transposase